MRKAWLLGCALGLAPAAYAQELSFSDAVAQASEAGPTIEAGLAGVEAAQSARRAAGRLPDPQLVLGLENVPVDGSDAFSLERDFMTMRSVGIMQDMPSGGERRARRAMAQAETQRAEAGLDIARLAARLGAARAWINLYFAERRIAVLSRIAAQAQTSARAARGRLAGGAGGIDDLIAAEIEAARVEDRRTDLGASVVSARAELKRWLGDAGDEPLAQDAPVFVIDAERLRERLRHHPELAAFQAADAAAQANLRMARAERAPDWSWSLMYQKRGEAFSDMASVEVRVGLPLFQGSRQQPIIDARQAEVARVSAERRGAEREHGAMLEAQLAEHAAVSATLSRLREIRLPLAQRRAEAAAGAFAAGRMNATDMIAARQGLLEIELETLDLEQRLAALGAAMTLQYAEDLP